MDIKKGDIFEWRYKDEKKHSDYLNYWCCTRTALANDTHLVDIYWGDNSGSRGIETFENALLKWDLKLIANIDDLEKIEDWQNVYYRPEDIVNLNHSNNSRGNVYRRKGSTRNRKVMSEYAMRCLEGYRYKVESATRSVLEYEIKLAEISDEKTDLEKVSLQMP